MQKQTPPKTKPKPAIIEPANGKHLMTLASANRSIIKAYEYEQQAGEALLQADKHKQKAYKYMRFNQISHLDVMRKDKNVRLQSIDRVQVNYDIGALRKKFPAKIMNEITETTCTVLDLYEFQRLMYKYKVNLKELNPLLKVVEKVKGSRVDDLYDAGFIKLKDLKGCFTVSESVSLKLKELEPKE